jgi:hypothetical protein
MRGGVHLRDFNQRMSHASCRNGRASATERYPRVSIPKDTVRVERSSRATQEYGHDRAGFINIQGLMAATVGRVLIKMGAGGMSALGVKREGPIGKPR